MRISKIVLKNFRCFGPIATAVEMAELTALVGANAAGKTAILHALMKLFGRSGADRELVSGDFHIPRNLPGATPSPVTERTLFIEALLEFPELLDEAADHDAVAECFRHMIVAEPGHPPVCRVRLEATWNQGSVPEGVIEQHHYWIKGGALGEEEKKHEMRAVDRARIQVHYVPAIRDPMKQVRHASGSLIGRLFTAVNWSDTVKADVVTASDDIQAAFGREPGVTAVQKALSDNWTTVHDSDAYGAIAIRPVSKRFDEILRNIEAVFSPSPGDEEDPLERLSDGQRSLFYLAMVGAVFDIEEYVLTDADATKHFDRDRLDPPSLTIIALEEPENHIAPHYLGRIMDLLRKISASPRAQIVLTSHSTSIMHRVEPTEVRHLRRDATSRTTVVRPIDLPAETDEAFKFIREAVRAYPELYFAQFVILGEGDSEEVVLPRISEALGLRIDQSFVSVVPLGGRHVNHFWRLLKSLDIPHATLLDLDLEREGGGWGRIKYVVNQLLVNGYSRERALTLEGSAQITDEQLRNMHTWDVADIEQLKSWIKHLRSFSVFFSAPLDLDFLMLGSFPGAYKVIDAGSRGPSIPNETDANYTTRQKAAIDAVLKDAGGDGKTYSAAAKQDFFWYRFLFLGRGKPTTHLRALASLSNAQLKEHCPVVLQRLVLRMQDALKALPKDEVDGA